MLFVTGTYQNISPQSNNDTIIVNSKGVKEQRSDRLAIVIGVNNYSSIRPLNYAVPDARMIKETLESKGNFKVKYYADDYSDKTAKTPNKKNIMEALKDARNAANRGWIKTLVVYFSGHGMEINGNHYLAPIDAHPYILAKSDIDLNKVISLLNEAKENSKVMFFLDACRSDISIDRGEFDAWESDIKSRGLAILRSSSAGQPSYELPEYEHGIYSYYLNEGLKGMADFDGNGSVSYNELAKYLWQKMGEWSDTNDRGLTQIPRSESYEKYGEFFITKCGNQIINDSSDDQSNLSIDSIDPSDLESVPCRDMVPVDGGTYIQKSLYFDYKNNERFTQSFRHTISSFEIGKYEVTYELWYTVYQWAVAHGYCFANSGREGSDGSDGSKPTSSKFEPVTCVNWRDCIVWCNAYSEMSGYKPVYNLFGIPIKDSRDSNSNVCDDAGVDWSADGYRLPTEGEWQYAASNRGNTPYNYASGASDDYENESACKKVAWFIESDGNTHVVGRPDPNGIGLYDMSGNVSELCWDWYGSYPTSSKNDYLGIATGSCRVERGGSWFDFSNILQVGFRFGIYPSCKDFDLGFRLARRP